MLVLKTFVCVKYVSQNNNIVYSNRHTGASTTQTSLTKHHGKTPRAVRKCLTTNPALKHATQSEKNAIRGLAKLQQRIN